MRVTLVGSYYAPAVGGVETHMAQLAAELQKNGASVAVSCLANMPGRPATSGYTENIDGIAVHRVSTSGLGDSLRWPAELVPAGSADIVHFHGFARALVLRSWLDSRGTPLVITLHGGINGVFTDPVRLRRGLKRAFDVSVGRFVLNRASRIIALTAVEAEHLHRSIGIDSARITVMPNALAEDSLRLQPVAQGASGRLLVLSRLAARKRVGDLVNALAVLPDPVGCDIAGPDEGEGEHINRLAERLPPGTVRFLGPVDGETKTHLLRAARALVLPSSWEGLSISALEAIAQGTPVIASEAASAGLPQSACLTFPVGDIQALARCIQALDDEQVRILIQQQTCLARQGIPRVADHARQTMDIYREAIRASSR